MADSSPGLRSQLRAAGRLRLVLSPTLLKGGGIAGDEGEKKLWEVVSESDVDMPVRSFVKQTLRKGGLKFPNDNGETSAVCEVDGFRVPMDRALGDIVRPTDIIKIDLVPLKPGEAGHVTTTAVCPPPHRPTPAVNATDIFRLAKAQAGNEEESERKKKREREEEDRGNEKQRETASPRDNVLPMIQQKTPADTGNNEPKRPSRSARRKAAKRRRLRMEKERLGEDITGYIAANKPENEEQAPVNNNAEYIVRENHAQHKSTTPSSDESEDSDSSSSSSDSDESESRSSSSDSDESSSDESEDNDGRGPVEIKESILHENGGPVRSKDESIKARVGQFFFELVNDCRAAQGDIEHDDDGSKLEYFRGQLESLGNPYSKIICSPEVNLNSFRSDLRVVMKGLFAFEGNPERLLSQKLPMATGTNIVLRIWEMSVQKTPEISPLLCGRVIHSTGDFIVIAPPPGKTWIGTMRVLTKKGEERGGGPKRTIMCETYCYTAIVDILRALKEVAGEEECYDLQNGTIRVHQTQLVNLYRDLDSPPLTNADQPTKNAVGDRGKTAPGPAPVTVPGPVRLRTSRLGAMGPVLAKLRERSDALKASRATEGRLGSRSKSVDDNGDLVREGSQVRVEPAKEDNAYNLRSRKEDNSYNLRSRKDDNYA